MIALGHYATQLDFEKKEDRNKEHDNFLHFLKTAKRPYGSKNIEQSIIYVLGLDSQWTMRFICQPDFVTSVANGLHTLLIEDIEKRWKDSDQTADNILRL